MCHSCRKYYDLFENFKDDTNGLNLLLMIDRATFT